MATFATKISSCQPRLSATRHSVVLLGGRQQLGACTASKSLLERPILSLSFQESSFLGF